MYIQRVALPRRVLVSYVLVKLQEGATWVLVSDKLSRLHQCSAVFRGFVNFQWLYSNLNQY